MYLLGLEEFIGLLKPEADDHPLIKFIEDKLRNKLVFVSTVTIGEAVDSISHIQDFEARQRAELNMDVALAKLSDMVLEFGIREAKYWGTLRNTDASDDIYAEELQVISVAIVNDLQLVCRSRPELAALPVQIVDPY